MVPFTPPNYGHTFTANLSLQLTHSHFHKSDRAEAAFEFPGEDLGEN